MSKKAIKKRIKLDVSELEYDRLIELADVADKTVTGYIRAKCGLPELKRGRPVGAIDGPGVERPTSKPKEPARRSRRS